MVLKSLKKIVTTAGTPVQLFATKTNCISFMVQPIPTNTGKSHVGTSAIVVSTFTGILGVLLVPSATLQPSFSVQINGALAGHSAYAAIDLSSVWIDAAVNGEGVLVTYETAT